MVSAAAAWGGAEGFRVEEAWEEWQIIVPPESSSSKISKNIFLNFGTVFLTAVRMMKLRKAYCSPPLVGEDNSMVFTSHSVPFPAFLDLWSLVAENGTS